MGAIADELADQIIVTDDNPRSENPQAITRAIVGGIKSHAARVIHDRGDAIATALREAGPGDVVLIAGKGHEELPDLWRDAAQLQRSAGSSALSRGGGMKRVAA